MQTPWAEQCAHATSHALHEPESAKKPLGQTAMQVPVRRSARLEELSQLVQLEAELGALQPRHEGSHARHSESPDAAYPDGQLATH